MSVNPEAAADLPRCKAKWGNCQFQSFGFQLYEYDGLHYCPLHLPFNAERKLHCNFEGALLRYLESRGTDLSCVHFPHAMGVELQQAPGDLILNSCVFPGDQTIQIAGATIEDTTFGGPMRFVVHRGIFRVRAYFPSTLHVRVSHPEIVDFSGCYFGGAVEISNAMNGKWSFARATFARPLTLLESGADVSEQISFALAKFLRGACPVDSEGGYRRWRKKFEQRSDRENEGLFYALEKRSHRRGLKFPGFARSISALYEWVSQYGQSYERALLWLLGLQMTMFVVYRLRFAHETDDFGVSPSLMQIVAFTMSQVAKPFELLSARGAGADSSLSVILLLDASDRSLWSVVGFLHSALSVALVALTVLALRWRFRRA